MGVKFLSDQWFEHVEAARKAIDNFEVPPALQRVTLNITATHDGDEVRCCMAGGLFQQGHIEDAPVTLVLPRTLAYRIFIENDQGAGMQGFMSGELRVQGDMSVIMALQSVEPSKSHREFQAAVQAFTEQ
ncbi:MAG: SCP2 sterol-binding domain-containing protein [Gammaproteobacteria bacterium]